MSDIIRRADAIEALMCHFVPQTYTGEQVEQAKKLAKKIVNGIPSAHIKTDVDLISRQDAIEAVKETLSGNVYWDYVCDAVNALSALPSAEGGDAETNPIPTGTGVMIQSPNNGADLIRRADAIELLTEIVFDEPPYFDSETLCRLYAEEQINTLPSAEIAETEPIAIRSKTLLPTKDFKEWAKRIKEVNPNAVVIPCDAEVVSAVQGWIPCSERLPKTGDSVLVTYSDGEVDIIWSARPKAWVKYEEANNLIYPVAWMPLPKPYKEDDNEN